MTQDGIEARLAVVETRVSDILTRTKVIEETVLDLRLCRARDEWKDRILWLVIGVAVPSVLAIMAAAARTALLSPASQLTP